MLKRIAAIAGGAVLVMACLFIVAGRPLTELLGYFRAGASTTVKKIEDEIPDAIHDEKAATELAAAREQLVDRQVQLNLSQNQLKNLEHEIASLEKAVADRGQVLASAYPVLQNAVNDGKGEVTFVSANFSLSDFQHELDDLLSMQERDENALRIKKAGFERLKQSVNEGASALAAMKNEMLEIEQEFAVLQTRRDQARVEADTLDLVAGATSSSQSSTANIGKSIERLEGQVEQLEAHNSARRDVAPVNQRAATGKLTKTFNRLETLKKYAAQNGVTQNAVAEPAEPVVNAGSNENSNNNSSILSPTPFDANEVVIRITGEKDESVGK